MTYAITLRPSTVVPDGENIIVGELALGTVSFEADVGYRLRIMSVMWDETTQEPVRDDGRRGALRMAVFGSKESALAAAQKALAIPLRDYPADFGRASDS